MNKYIFTVLALITVAAGCTKSNFVDVPEPQSTPISFETYTGKTPVTKATSETTVTLTKKTPAAFRVKAFEPGIYTTTWMDEDVWCESATYDDEQNPTAVTEATWAYDGTTYWPASGKLKFVAYGNVTAGHIEETDKVTFTYKVDDKASLQEDLIVALPVETETMPAEGKVNLTFNHLLSKVGFTLKTTQQGGVTVTIKSIKLKGTFYPQGTVKLTDAAPAISIDGETPSVTSYSLFDTEYPMTGATGKYDYFQISSPGEAGTGIYANRTYTKTSAEMVTDTEKEGASASNRYMMLIPKGTVTGAEVVYQLPGAKERTVPADLVTDIILEAGRGYEFIIKLSTDAIEFEGKVVDWDETPENEDIPKAN